MNYMKIYDSIIDNAVNDKRSKGLNYYENHHIIPKCLGGNNNSNNKVLLTAKEHYVCHKLLCEIHPTNKSLKFAFWAMCNQISGVVNRTYKITSHEYSRAKKMFAESNSIKHKGKKLNESHIQIIRERMLSDKNPNRGKVGILSPLFRKKVTNSVKKKISKTKSDNPERNGNFKGHYITPLGKFTSSTIASKLHKLDNTVIISRCKDNMRKITRISNSRDLTINDIGKTYYELGWSFISTSETILPESS